MGNFDPFKSSRSSNLTISLQKSGPSNEIKCSERSCKQNEICDLSIEELRREGIVLPDACRCLKDAVGDITLVRAKPACGLQRGSFLNYVLKYKYTIFQGLFCNYLKNKLSKKDTRAFEKQLPSSGKSFNLLEGKHLLANPFLSHPKSSKQKEERSLSISLPLLS